MTLVEKAKKLQAAAKSTRLLREAATPLKVLMQDCLKQLGDSDAQSQQLIPTLEQSQRNFIHSR